MVLEELEHSVLGNRFYLWLNAWRGREEVSRNRHQGWSIAGVVIFLYKIPPWKQSFPLKLDKVMLNFYVFLQILTNKNTPGPWSNWPHQTNAHLSLNFCTCCLKSELKKIYHTLKTRWVTLSRKVNRLKTLVILVGLYREKKFLVIGKFILLFELFLTGEKRNTNIFLRSLTTITVTVWLKAKFHYNVTHWK